MEKVFASCLLLFLGLLITPSLSAEIRIHPNCSGQARPCNLLASLTVPTVPNVTLTFMPGVHLLPSSITIQGKRHWKLNGIGESTILCTGQGTCHIDFSYSRNLKISNLTFASSKLWFSKTSHIDITNSQFLNATEGAIKFTDSFNVKMDRCYFNNYYRFHSYKIMEFVNVGGLGITRSEAKNTVHSSWYHSSTVWMRNTTGHIGCSRFENNRDDSIIVITGCSSVYTSNCSFNNNTVNEGVYSSLEHKCDKGVIVSSTFSNSYTYRRGIITTRTSPVVLLASKFTSNRGSPMWSYDATNIVDCSEFPVSIVSPRTLVHSNSDLCKWHIVGDAALCRKNLSCNLEDCSLPEVRISLEQSEYTVYEGIGKASRALQICAVARDLLIPIDANIHAHNGTAIENQDFIMTQSKCQPFKFLRKAGIQKECTFIRIIDDSVNENNEQFSVSLVADKPYIPNGIRRATVTIMETNTAVSTPTPTTMPVTEDPTIQNVNSPFYTAIVECGPLRRLVNYSNAGNKIENLKSAIVQSFRGLTGLNASHIAILQLKSDIHGGYIDLISGSPAILNNSFVKVLTYDKFSCVPKIGKQ